MIKTITQGIARCTRWHRASLLPALTGGAWGWVFIFTFTSCEREPVLHLYDSANAEFEFPAVDLDLQVLWNYEIGYNITYDWKAEWNYGWDLEDVQIFGEIGYAEPKVFQLRRYYLGDEPNAPHTRVQSHTLEKAHFQGNFEWGFWDLLIWNEVHTLDGVQSLVFDETTTLDHVTAETHPTMQSSRYQAPRYTTSFYAPEALFAAYDTNVEIDRDLSGFEFDEERNIYVKKLNMTLRPITYIYLTQVILHHNNGRIAQVDGNANLSGMARTTTLNTGMTGDDPVTIYFNTRLKKDMPLIPYDAATAQDPAATADPTAERVDIIGGRLLSFGLCNTAANRVTRADDLTDTHRHYLDVSVQFNNGMDSTLVFDVTKQVRERYKGGVISVELDMDTVPIPQRAGGSGFNAVVKDIEDGGTYEFEM